VAEFFCPEMVAWAINHEHGQWQKAAADHERAVVAIFIMRTTETPAWGVIDPG
jgi:hypothetical protein